MRPVEQIAATTVSAPSPMFQAVIDSVQEDGTVNLLYMGAILDGVPCSPDANVAAGDVVVVATMSGGVNAVLARFARPAPPPPPDPNIPLPPPDPPATGSIDPMGPSDTGSWRNVNGSMRYEDDKPRQARYASSFGPYTGCWTFPGLGAACAGKTVSKITLSLARSAAANGIGGSATVRLYLTKASKVGNDPPSKYNLWTPGKLGRGVRDTWRVPTDWKTDLASGVAHGIVCYSDVENESIIFSKDARIAATFS